MNKTATLPELEALRSRIDHVDESLLELMSLRQELATEAALVKEANGFPLQDLAREAAIVRRASHLARMKGLEPELTRDVFWKLIGLCRIRGRENAPLRSQDRSSSKAVPE